MIELLHMLVVKNLPANAGDVRDVVRSLGQEDPLEGVATFSILAWKIPLTEEPGRLQFIGSERVGLKRLGKQASNIAKQVQFKGLCFMQGLYSTFGVKCPGEEL